MSWVRAVWVEGDTEEEGTVPDTWAKENMLFWPPVANSLRYLKERKEPTDKWKKFPIIKIKLRSGGLYYWLKKKYFHYSEKKACSVSTF